MLVQLDVARESKALQRPNVRIEPRRAEPTAPNAIGLLMLALVTGASSGIGAEIAVLLASRGDRAILVGRDRESLENVARRCQDAVVFPCDLSIPSAIDSLLASHPEIDILVNCAGFAGIGNFAERDWPSAETEFAVNAIVPLRLCHHYLRGMRQRDRGQILNVASSAALVAAPGYAIYAASKASILEFSESLALELAGTNISVSCLIPGPTATQFCRRAGLRDVPQAMSPESVASYALQVMDRGLAIGTPGRANQLKQTLKRVLPRAWWRKVIKSYMQWRTGDANG